MPQNWIDKRLDQDPDFAVVSEAEALVLSTCDAIYDELDQRGLRQNELANRLHVSKANVSQLLKGRNLTLRTLARIAYALGLRVAPIRFEPLDAGHPMGIPPGEPSYFFRQQIVIRTAVLQIGAPGPQGADSLSPVEYAH